MVCVCGCCCACSDIAIAKRDGIEVELRMFTLDGWAKRVVQQQYMSDGQCYAMKV